MPWLMCSVRRACWVLCLFGFVGCARPIELRAVASSVDRPGNVAVYLDVRDGDEPLTDLSAKDFRIYEDGQLIDPARAKQVLLDRDLGAVRHTVVIVDLSEAAAHPDALGQIRRGLSAFLKRVRKTQGVTVYGFSGGEDLVEIGSKDPVRADGELSELQLDTNDTSRNLNGAILHGLEALETDLPSAPGVISLGTLVVVTTGPDLAGRVAAVRVKLALDHTPYRVLAVGLDRARDTLAQIGRDGMYGAAALSGLPDVLSSAARDIEKHYRSSYVLAYCSPARSGRRRLRVEVATHLDGRERTGAYETMIDAHGFSPDCDPTTPPHFVLPGQPRPREEEPAPEPRHAPRAATTAHPPSEPAPDENDGFIP